MSGDAELKNDSYTAPKPTGAFALFFKKRWEMPSILIWDIIELPLTIVSYAIYYFVAWLRLLYSTLFRPLQPQRTIFQKFFETTTDPLSAEFIGKKILQAQNISNATFDHRNKAFRRRAAQDAAVSVTYPIVKIHPTDGSDVPENRRDRIDTVEIRPVNQTPTHYHIYVLGTSMCYQDNNVIDGIDVFDIMKRDVLENNCCAIGLNYRGVGTISSPRAPKSKQDMVNDVIAQVNRLREQGVPADNITLDGVSLGAGIATLVAFYFHAHGYQVHLRNDRGFTSLASTIAGWVWNWQHPLNPSLPQDRKPWQAVFGTILAPITWVIAKITLSAFDFEIEAGFAYACLPDTHKKHICVRSSDKRRENGTVLDDPVIPDCAALHNSSYMQAYRQMKRWKLCVSSSGEKKQYEDKINASQMYTDDGEESENAHLYTRDKLKNHLGQTGLQFLSRNHSSDGKGSEHLSHFQTNGALPLK